jgi:O-antigen/teichoic acid export membrane protein
VSDIKRNIFFTFITQFPTQFLGIITGIFITRMIGPEGRGIYVIFLADVDLFVTIFGLSISNAIIYHFANGVISKNKIYGISLIIIGSATILFVITTFAILFSSFGALFFPKNNINILMIFWFLAAIFITLLSNILNAIFQGYKEFKVVNKVALANSFLNILVFGCIFIFHKITKIEVSAEFVLSLTLVVLSFNLGLWYFYLLKHHKELKPNFKVSIKNEVKPILKYLGIGHLSNIINFLNYRFSLWIIVIYLSVAEVGYFGLAVGIAGILNLVTTPIFVVLMPYLSTESYDSRRKIFIQYSRLNCTVLLIAGLIGFIIAPLFIPMVYGEVFSPSIVVFQICLIGAVFSAQNKIWGIYNMSNNRQFINLYATIIGLVLTVSCSFVLIPKFGLIGATIGSIITFICMFVFLYIDFLIHNSFNFTNIFIINKNDITKIKALYESKRRGRKFLQ